LTENGGPTGSVPTDAQGRATVDLALQVANVAAQVSAAMRANNPDKRDELRAQLALAQGRLEEQGAPPGLIPFLTVMQGLLQGEDVSPLVDELPTSYRAVYQQLVDELQMEDADGVLTLREVLDEVTHNVIVAMVRGTFDQKRRMADTLLAMQEESRSRPDLAALRDLLQAARLLLLGEDPTPVADRLHGPFLEHWETILDATQEP
jgi:hypothetical protein